MAVLTRVFSMKDKYKEVGARAYFREPLQSFVTYGLELIIYKDKRETVRKS
jgi:hypothetical protein